MTIVPTSPAKQQTVAANAPPAFEHAPLAGGMEIPAAPVPEPIELDDAATTASVGNVFAGLLPVARRDAAANDALIAESDTERRGSGGDVNAKMRRVMAVRLVRARMLSGLSQGDVSRAIGLKTQTQVALWEKANRLITLADLVRVADVLGVSESYLLGTSDEPERDQSAALRSACLRGVRKQLERVAEITVDSVAAHARLVGPHAGQVRGLLAAGDDLLEAFSGFVRANSGEFSHQRGGATLQRRAQEFEAALTDARTAIRAHDALDGDLRRALADIALEDELVGDDEA